jgi:hypothetical protein
MSRLIRAIESTAAQFQKQHISFALVGGLAVSARTEPRFTRDADFAVATQNDREAEAMVRSFLSLQYQVVSTVEQDARNRLATVRLSPPAEDAHGVVVDLLFASSGIENEIVTGADRMEVFNNVVLPVCTTGHLLALKVLSHDDDRRPQDIMDIHKLIQVANESDLSCARSAVTLIEERGFNRERDLSALLEQFICKEKL